MNVRGLLLLSAAALLGACGGSDAPGEAASDGAVVTPAPASAPSGGELTARELEQGIGPIHDMELAPVDAALAETGEAAFNLKCSACHKVEERYIGPELGMVLERRTPEFVMNMILNSNEMVQRHPVVREMLAEYFTPMPTQVTDQDEARAILEYLRSVQVDSNQEN